MVSRIKERLQEGWRWAAARPYSLWLAAGVAVLIGLWWATMTPTKIGATLFVAVVLIVVGVFLHPSVAEQGTVAHYFWTLLAASALAVLGYYTFLHEVQRGQTTQAVAGRIYVTRPVEEITALYKNQTSYQADKLFEAYKGKWIRVVGAVLNVSTLPDGELLVIGSTSTSEIKEPTLAMRFVRAPRHRDHPLYAIVITCCTAS